MVYRLLTRKTYEMEMFHQASLKLGLDRAVLAHARNEQEDESSSSSAIVAKPDFTLKEIDELLKRGYVVHLLSFIFIHLIPPSYTPITRPTPL